MKKNLGKLALAMGLMGMAGTGMAATDTANLAVGATVVNACAIGPGSIAFGSHGLPVNAGLGTVTGANVDADSGTTVSIACTNGASATITGGLGAHAAVAVRRMISGSDFLSYELYADSGHTTVLDTTTGNIAYTGTGAADTAHMVIYGRITAAQLAAAVNGVYADTVAMTITYTP